MKHLVWVTLFLLILSCKTKSKLEPQPISSDEIKNMISFLASDELMGRMTGSDGIEAAASYIENQFKAYGVKPYFETYRDEFNADGAKAFNMVGYVEGNDEKLKNETIILGAHYDHIGYGSDAKKKSKKGSVTEIDSIANGANDNASGTSAVLAAAKYFAERKTNKRSIMFVLFSAEEIRCLGSKHLAKRLKLEGLNLYTMINFEMIGVPLKDTDYQVFLSGYDLSNMADKINEYVGGHLIGSSEFAIKNNLFKRSDNFPFYEEFKLPCQTISSCDLSNYDYYHHVYDEIEQLDLEFMARLINQTIPAIDKMSNTPTKEIIMYESE